MTRTKLTPDVVRAIGVRKAQGLTIAALSREFGLSDGSIHRAIQLYREDPANAAQHVAPAVTDRDDLPEAGGEALEHLEIREILARRIKDLDEMAEGADPEQRLAVSRVLATAAIQLAKLTPPAAPKAEDNPDMIAAAASFRDRLRLAIEHERMRLAGLPICDACGHAIDSSPADDSPIGQLVRLVLG